MKLDALRMVIMIINNVEGFHIDMTIDFMCTPTLGTVALHYAGQHRHVPPLE